MRRISALNKSLWWRRAILGMVILVWVTMPTSTAQVNDHEFRLTNVERRLDQVQLRIEMIEREQRTQALNTPRSTSTSTETLLEMQRQYLSMAQQMAVMQKQLFELQKTVDQLSGRGEGQKKTDKVDEKKPTPTPTIKK